MTRPERPDMKAQRGEGKIGCVVSLLVLLLMGAVCGKLVPVLYSNNALLDTADDLASKAGILAVPTLELQLRDSAKNLGITEAGAQGAMTITTVGQKAAGTCTIKIKYAREVDFYGIYTLTITTDKTIMKPYMDAR